VLALKLGGACIALDALAGCIALDGPAEHHLDALALKLAQLVAAEHHLERDVAGEALDVLAQLGAAVEVVKLAGDGARARRPGPASTPGR